MDNPIAGKKIAVICNGSFPTKEYPLYLIRTADCIVCCDGAVSAYCRNMKKIFGRDRYPDIVIGDLDSAPASLLKRLADRIVHVAEQESNDMTKAVRHIMASMTGVSEITVFGASGKREDHTIGNLSLLMEYAREYDLGSMGIMISAVSDYSTAFAITDTAEFRCGTGRVVSIFSPDSTLTIKSSGLEWPTDNVVFDNWWKATLNRSNQDTVKLELSHRGMVLVILD